MERTGERDGIRRRGGALFGELRRLELMHESGSLDEAAYRRARARLMRSVSDADLAEEASARPAPAATAAGGLLPTLGAAGLAAVAMLLAPAEALVWISVAGLATVALAACWEA